MTKCYIYKYNLLGQEELVHESRNYRFAREVARQSSEVDHDHTYRLQVQNYPFRFYEKGVDVTENFRKLLMCLQPNTVKSM